MLLGYFEKTYSYITGLFLFAPLRSFNGKTHRRALIKSAFLMFFSFFPFMAIGIFSNKSVTIVGVYGEIYVYCAAFLAPVLYMFVERFLDYRDQKKDDPDAAVSLEIFEDAYIVLIISVVILFFAATGYGFFKSGEGVPSWVSEHGWILYIISIIVIYYWYLAIADSEIKNPNYTESFRNNEEDFINKAIKLKGHNDE